jgi:Sedlin, N-terminal conserved region
MLAAVGVVSPSNAPLWLRCYHPSEEPRRLHTVLHCALDGVDERLGAPGGTKARRCSWGHTHTRASGALLLLSTRLPAFTRAHVCTQDTGAAYLGLLSPRDEYLVYGYVSCTRVKFLLAFDGPARVLLAPLWRLLRSSQHACSVYSCLFARRLVRRRCGRPSSDYTRRTWTPHATPSKATGSRCAAQHSTRWRTVSRGSYGEQRRGHHDEMKAGGWMCACLGTRLRE